MSYQLEEFLPHRAPMVLLDGIVDVNDDHALCEVNISDESPLFMNGEVPAWVGIEYMAQAVAVYAGNAGRKKGEVPAVGFLLGSRKYKTTVPAFKKGQRLFVKAQPTLIDGSVGSFKCTVSENETVVAEATITTFKPSEDMLNKLRARPLGAADNMKEKLHE